MFVKLLQQKEMRLKQESKKVLKVTNDTLLFYEKKILY